MFKKHQKGSSIFLVVIMLSVVLSVVLGLTSIIVGGSKMTESLSYSVRAFHAADTGMEEALYRIRKQSNCDDFSDEFSTDYGYTVTITYTGGSCADTGTTITSMGEYLGINRKLETSY
jgi:Tfp pilus assembly protein PilX